MSGSICLLARLPFEATAVFKPYNRTQATAVFTRQKVELSGVFGLYNWTRR